MFEHDQIPDVEPTEITCRYIISRSHLRQDKTVRPDAFVPHPYEELSVTRQRETTSIELWVIGRSVALQCGKQLHGRADVEVATFIGYGLTVVADPIASNLNHANVIDWPSEKAMQKSIALLIAATCKFIQSDE